MITSELGLQLMTYKNLTKYGSFYFVNGFKDEMFFWVTLSKLRIGHSIIDPFARTIKLISLSYDTE